jgi:thioredoxin reductase
MKDLVIIGAAAAGCSAAIYAARRNLDFKIITKDIGGEVTTAGEIENWPGQIHTTGEQLANDFEQHVNNYNVEIDNFTEVVDIICKENKLGIVTNSEEKIETKTVIIATGIHPKRLKVPGEKKFKGKGLTYCTVCDGPLFEDKITTTIGAGDAALESALMLSKIANQEYLVTKYPNDKKHKGGFPKAEDILIDKVKNNENIEIIYDAITQKIFGEGMVEKIIYKNQSTGEEKSLTTKGVMVHIGVKPNTDLVNCVEKNNLGEIKIDKFCRTSQEGIFAAGDVTDISYNQISIAAGHGTTAALSAIDYLNKQEAN